MADLYERLHAEVKQHVDHGDTAEAGYLADALLAVVERHKPVARYVNSTWLYCRACNAPAEKCDEIPAIARDLGVDP